MRSMKQKGSFRIMCLGESTTQDQYPPFLEDILNQRNIGIKFSVIDKSIGGTKTTAILKQLEANLDRYRPDMVIAMMGTNDGGSHIPYETSSAPKIILTLRSFKTYKLVRLLQLHIVTKLKEKGLCSQEINKQKNLSREEYEKLHQEQSLKKAIEINPNDGSAYVELGRLCIDQARFAESEELLKKAIELNPNNDSTYIELGKLYKSQGKSAKSEESFKKAIEINPNDGSAYVELGRLCIDQARFAKSEESFKKAIKLNPNNDSTYIELGKLYRNQARFAESEELLKKAIELNPNNDAAYAKLGWLYIDQARFAESQELFKKAIELNPDNKRLYGNLIAAYFEINGNKKLIEDHYFPITIKNYHMLKQILDKRNIKLVCVQYPVRSVASLKKIFKDENEGNIVFVDNEKIFKEAIKKKGYKKYFKDMFRGDFGHCTEKGNKLLAENIANVILKKIFKK